MPPPVLVWPGLPLVYLLLPGHPGAPLPGLPLDDRSFGLALVLTLFAWCGARPVGLLLKASLVLLAAATVLRLVVVTLAPPNGLQAIYSASGDPTVNPERSTEQRRQGFTRVDLTVNFIGDQFPLHFWNDQRRFNFYTAGQPRRDLLPFAALWRGSYVAEHGNECLQLDANGSASLRLDQTREVRVDRASHVETRQLCLGSAGLSPLELRYARPDGGVPYLRLSRLDSDGRPVTVEPRRLLQPDASPGRDLMGLAFAADVLFGVSLALALVAALRHRWRIAGPGWERPLLATSLLVAFAEATQVYAHLRDRTAILSGGNDWMAYESYARDVQLSGLLMTAGRPLGQVEAFYYQPLYIYHLAGLHALFGESLYGPLVAQYVLVAFSGVLTYYLARELFGRPTALVCFALFWLFRYLIFNPVAGLLLSENLVAIIVPGLLLMLTRWCRTGSRSDLLMGGVFVGLAGLARSTPLMLLPPALLVIGLTGLRRGRRRAVFRDVTAFVAVTMLVWSLIAIRNYLVSGQAVWLPTSATTNIYEVHRPGPNVDLSRINRDPLYERLGFDRRTREVLEFIKQDPLGYAASLVPQGLYTVGYTGPALGTSQVQWELIGLSTLYLLALLLVPATRALPVWLLHGFVWTHFLQMMVFMAHQYGFRLPMPMYGPMTVVAAAGLTAAFARLWRAGRSESPPQSSPAPVAAPIRMSSSAARALVPLTISTALAVSLLVASRPPDVEAAIFGLGGDAAQAARSVATGAASWQADRIYFGGQDARSLNVAYMPGLRYREMKWAALQGGSLDSAVQVWPAPGLRGLLVPPPGASPPSRWDCVEPGGAQGLARIEKSAMALLPVQDGGPCTAGNRRLASFGGLLTLLAAGHATMPTTDQPAVRAAWRVQQRPSFRVLPVVEALDPNGLVIDRAVAEPYPAGSWEPGEVVVAYLAVPSTNRPGARLAIAFARGGAEQRLAIDDPLPLFGQTRFLIEG